MYSTPKTHTHTPIPYRLSNLKLLITSSSCLSTNPGILFSSCLTDSLSYHGVEWYTMALLKMPWDILTGLVRTAWYDCMLVLAQVLCSLIYIDRSVSKSDYTVYVHVHVHICSFSTVVNLNSIRYSGIEFGTIRETLGPLSYSTYVSYIWNHYYNHSYYPLLYNNPQLLLDAWPWESGMVG